MSSRSTSPPSQSAQHIAVIGAGFSGLSAALCLLQQGHAVTVFEAAGHAGGRARGLTDKYAGLDNGQHLCIGAYRETLDMLSAAGIDPQQVFLRLPLALHMHDAQRRWSLVTPRWLPAPLHLLVGLVSARGMGWQMIWAALRWMLQLRLKRFQLAEDCSVAQLLAAGRQPPALISMLWEPLCLAALNTPITDASAQVFLNVLRDSLLSKRADSDFLIAKQDLSRALIHPLVAKIQALGGEVKLATTVDGWQATAHGWAVLHGEAQTQVHQIIVAVGPHQRKTLRYEDAPVYRYEAITTLYLQCAAETRLPMPVIGLCGGLAQWVFDRGQCCNQPGLLAVVISAHGQLPEKAALVSQCLTELNQRLHVYGLQLKTPQWTQVITEKRATFACVAHAVRPSLKTAQAGVWLAGDDVENGYPATIEGSVRNGRRAAQLAIQYAAASMA